MDKFHNYGLYSDIAETKGAYLSNTKAYEAFWMIKQEIKDRSVSLALSFGKDSMTMLHLCHKHNLLKDIKIVMWNNSGMEYPDALDFRDYVLDYYNVDNFVETCPEDPFSYFLDKDVLNDSVMKDFVYDCLEKPRWKKMDENEIDCTLLGLRNEESKARRINNYMRGSWIVTGKQNLS